MVENVHLKNVPRINILYSIDSEMVEWGIVHFSKYVLYDISYTLPIYGHDVLLYVNNDMIL